MKRQSHVIGNVPGRLNQRNSFLNAPFREAIVNDVAIALSLE
jgi:hypothetical protein